LSGYIGFVDENIKKEFIMEKMHKSVVIIAIFITSLFILNCSSPPQKGPRLDGVKPEQIVAMEPDWYTNQGAEEGYIMAKGEGTSPAKTGARSIAVSNLKGDFSSRMKTINELRTKAFFVQTGGDYDSSVEQKFEELNINISNNMIENYEEIKSVTIPEKSKNPQGQKVTIYRTYITAKINKYTSDQRLLDKIKLEQDILTAVKESVAYKDLQEDLEKYRKKFGMDN